MGGGRGVEILIGLPVFKECGESAIGVRGWVGLRGVMGGSARTFMLEEITVVVDENSGQEQLEVNLPSRSQDNEAGIPCQLILSVQYNLANLSNEIISLIGKMDGSSIFDYVDIAAECNGSDNVFHSKVTNLLATCKHYSPLLRTTGDVLKVRELGPYESFVGKSCELSDNSSFWVRAQYDTVLEYGCWHPGIKIDFGNSMV
ncbi:hypothetical protein Tco_0895102 [Tanacetum coccineum]|uniref:Uncharacterized protein n=1 Tax=Tanacetum coccineum TaxID=301880 RepID=A0ABQ5CDL0_9ASTR